MGKIKQLIYNSYFLASLISLPFILYILLSVSRYKIEEIESSQVPDNLFVYYNDLDNDGLSEKIVFETNILGNRCVKIFNPGHQGQFNSKCKNVPQPSPSLFGDLNKDGTNEILFLGERDSAIYLNIFDYQTREISEHFVDKVTVPGTLDYNAALLHVSDMDLDGFMDVIISISAGFSLQPRALYIFNPATGALNKTPFQGSMLNGNYIHDIDGDGYPEIVANTYAYRNQVGSIPYTDSCTWLIAFDYRLAYKFEPVLISCKKSIFSTVPYIIGKESFLCGVSSIIESYKTPDELYLFSGKGEILLKKSFEKVDPSTSYQCQVFPEYDYRKLYYLRRDGSIFHLDRDLELKAIKKRKIFTNALHSYFDLNSDGKLERVFESRGKKKWIFTDLQFSNPVEVIYDWKPADVAFSQKLNGDKPPTFFIQSGNNYSELRYLTSPLWYWKYLFCAGVWGFFYLLILMISRIQAEKIRHQMQLQEQMNELQYRVVTSQFSPHYTFNVLNAISAKLYDTYPELYDYITKFSRQLRYLYAGRNELFRTLKDELAFCTDYLDIQKLRFPGKFDYALDIAGEVSMETIIPKMLVFTFVENSFKHGLRPIETGGHIDINARHTDKGIHIEIIDNGIGRQAATAYLKENPDYSTGRGLELLENLVQQLNKSSKQKIGWEMSDLTVPGKNGLKVTITLEG